MNYEETLDFLYQQLPMFQRQGPAAFKKDLGNTLALCEALRQPQNSFPVIHVAGTNGKGSVTHILAAILRQAGYKTGLYTSPHYKDFRERIKVNAEYIAEQKVVDFVAENMGLIDQVKPSFFELTVAMAFDHFRNEGVDVAVVETGLGGRLDSTNVVLPELSVITNIGLDHQQFLGNDLESITREKAGIIKDHVPVVIGEFQRDIYHVFEEAAFAHESPINCAEDRFDIQCHYQGWDGMKITLLEDDVIWLEEIETDLVGNYQLKNIRTALAAIHNLQGRGWTIEDEDIIKAMASIRQLSGLMGRMQVLSHEPLVIADSAHNQDGITQLLDTLKQVTYNSLHIVFGTVNDKDTSLVLSRMPQNATYYFCKPDIPRGKDVEVLKAEALKYSLTGSSYPSVNESYKAAMSSANGSDLVLVTGSIFVVGEVL